MKKNISRNPLWPDWYNGKKIDEVQFGRAFLEQWPLKCVNRMPPCSATVPWQRPWKLRAKSLRQRSRR